MAQEQDLTFITEDIPGATSIIQSGKSLRLGYVGRQEADYIKTIIDSGDKPEKISKKEWTKLRNSWKKEAEKIYPDEGDYKVWLVDVEAEKPIPVGSKVEFIGEVRENPGRDDASPEETPEEPT